MDLLCQVGTGAKTVYTYIYFEVATGDSLDFIMNFRFILTLKFSKYYTLLFPPSFDVFFDDLFIKFFFYIWISLVSYKTE